MRKVLGTFAAIALFATPVLAAEEVTGTILSVDEAAETFTLDTGEMIKAGPDIALDELQPGDEVRVTYEIENGDWVASQVEPADEAGVMPDVEEEEEEAPAD
jgi:hypothetical protein